MTRTSPRPPYSEETYSEIAVRNKRVMEGHRQASKYKQKEKLEAHKKLEAITADFALRWELGTEARASLLQSLEEAYKLGECL